jgi:hypothetical protein
MSHWLTYVRHSYEVVLEAEAKLCVNLEHNTEAYMVHLFARYMDNPLLNTEPVCIRILEGSGLPRDQKKDVMIKAADECLLIDGLSLSKKRWPNDHYYKDLGIAAYDMVANADRPPDTFYIGLAENFHLLSKVLNKCAYGLR